MTESSLASSATVSPAANPATPAADLPQNATRWMQKLAEEISTTPPDETGAPPGGATDVGDDDARLDARPIGAGLLLVLGLIWLIAKMWTTHLSVVGRDITADVAIASLALNLPDVVAASVLAGAAAGLVATARTWRRGLSERESDRPPSGAAAGVRRALTGLAAGMLPGLAAAGAILAAYGLRPSIGVLAATVGVAAALGGAAAAIPPPAFAAGIAATISVYGLGAVVNNFQSPLKSLLGAGSTPESQLTAANLLSFATAVVAGLVAGLVSFIYLRRRVSRRRWPAYLLAGAMPGLLLLLAEALTRYGGAPLLDVVRDLSAGDRTTVDYLEATRLNQALVVGFVGGIVATIAVGRTLRRPTDDPTINGPTSDGPTMERPTLDGPPIDGPPMDGHEAP